MATVILRTAYSSIVCGLYDFSVALCNAPGAMVARDVRDGKVSPQRAREVYRVVVTDGGEVDEDATQRLRAANR